MMDTEIENEIANAKLEDGSFPISWVMEMNNAGIWFLFTAKGVRWSRKPFAVNN